RGGRSAAAVAADRQLVAGRQPAGDGLCPALQRRVERVQSANRRDALFDGPLQQSHAEGCGRSVKKQNPNPERNADCRSAVSQVASLRSVATFNVIALVTPCRPAVGDTEDRRSALLPLGRFKRAKIRRGTEEWFASA